MSAPRYPQLDPTSPADQMASLWSTHQRNVWDELLAHLPDGFADYDGDAGIEYIEYNVAGNVWIDYNPDHGPIVIIERVPGVHTFDRELGVNEWTLAEIAPREGREAEAVRIAFTTAHAFVR